MAKPRRPRPSKRPTRERGESAAPLPSKRPKAKTKGKTTARRPAVVVIDDDDDVFILPRRPAAPSFPHPALAPDATLADEDDEPVFMAKAGAPVMVQSDWVDDSNKSYADMLAGASDGAVLVELPDAISLDELGLIADARAIHGARCKYGCAGGASKLPTIAAHHYTCQYWKHEGQARTPFDSNLGNLNTGGERGARAVATGPDEARPVSNPSAGRRRRR